MALWRRLNSNVALWRHHGAYFLFSSCVNDQICDCCDGSDEYDGSILCPNTCVMGGHAEYRMILRRLHFSSDMDFQEAEAHSFSRSLVLISSQKASVNSFTMRDRYII